MIKSIPYGHMVHDYYIGKIRSLYEKRGYERAEVKTKRQAQELVKDVRKRIKKSFGKFPAKTPLKAQVKGRLKLDGVVIEKIIFESRPGFPVTANLYMPENITGKIPGVIGACGHSDDGKANEPYKRFCLELALKGFAVLIYDPISQGERHQYLLEKHPLIPEGLCPRHNMLGNVMQLNGDFFGTWRAWDGIRALDYLLTRPEIDSNRIGVTGNSGGGTLTSYLNALDKRFTMAAPSCFITTYLRNMENELPQDSEQNPPGFFKYGLEMADFIIARAPRPVIILGQRNDFFDARGIVETYEEVRRVYKLLGKENNVKYFIGPDGHGYHQPNRMAMYDFFMSEARIKGTAEESGLELPDEKDLFCTDSGQVVKSFPGCAKVFEMTQKKAVSFKSERPELSGKQLKKTVKKILNIKQGKRVPYYRILRPFSRENIWIHRFAVETGPGIKAILYSMAEEPYFYLDRAEKAELYIPHTGVCQDMNAGEGACPPDTDKAAFALDVRGTGESMPVTCQRDDYLSAYGGDFLFACAGSMLNEPYLGGKVRDILETIKLLKNAGIKDITLRARGLGAIPALFAALLSDDVGSVVLKNSLLSYHELTQVPACKWPFSHMLYGVLKSFDLPDIFRELEDKGLILLDPWDEKMEVRKKNDCLESARSLGINRKIIKFSKQNKKK